VFLYLVKNRWVGPPGSEEHVSHSHIILGADEVGHLFLELIQWHVWFAITDDCVCSLPNLKQIDLIGADHEPRIVVVEAKVRDTTCMAAVHEQTEDCVSFVSRR
jgi:hypothetical protein